MRPMQGAELFRVSVGEDRPVVCAAHPATAYDEGTATLLADMTDANVVCVNPGGGTLEAMVDELEATRDALKLPPWVFWGMSGGGFLALLYAQRHPEGVSAIVVESACLCFRERLADPTCVLSPHFPQWRAILGDRVEASAHREPSSAADASWEYVVGLGEVFRRPDGAPLLVSPLPIDERMRAAMPELWRFDARSFVDSLRVRSLVIGGSADPVVPFARVRALKERLVGSELVEVEGGGHVPTASRHASVRAAARAFLA